MAGPQNPSKSRAPIGVFDSGLGGLTVVAALRQRLPHEDIVYLGDTARVPYGSRSSGVVRRYANGAAAFLLARRAKMLVVACNTASAHALGELQQRLPVPVLGVVEAGALMAATSQPDGCVGVLATEGTVQSQAYQRALCRLGPALRVVMQACPMLVPLAEEGLMGHPATRLLLEDYLRPVLKEQPRSLILGCTHYPVFLPLLSELCGPHVHIVNSAVAVAEVVARSLAEARLEAPATAVTSTLTLCTTDLTSRFKKTAHLFLGSTPPEAELVDLQP